MHKVPRLFILSFKKRPAIIIIVHLADSTAPNKQWLTKANKNSIHIFLLENFLIQIVMDIFCRWRGVCLIHVKSGRYCCSLLQAPTLYTLQRGDNYYSSRVDNSPEARDKKPRPRLHLASQAKRRCFSATLASEPSGSCLIDTVSRACMISEFCVWVSEVLILMCFTSAVVRGLML